MGWSAYRTPVLISVCTLAVACFCLARSVPHLLIHYRQDTGVLAVATVEKASVVRGTVRTGAGTEPSRLWQLRVRYRYQTEKGEFTGSNDQREPVFDDEGTARMALSALPPETTIRIRHLPGIHRLSWIDTTSLRTGVLRLHWLVAVLGVVFLGVVGFGLPGWLREIRGATRG